MNDNIANSQRQGEKVEVSIHLDAEVLEQLKHLTSDPSRVIETAIKEWLKGERDRDDELTRTFRRNPPVPPRGEWND
jgi:predicted DNA-binding antitoxin AbrB/MazE fold protein